MKMYKTIVIDDEPNAVDVLVHLLSKFPVFEVVQTFTDSVKAFTYLQQDNAVDVVFTDIAMPQISGLELVKLMQGKTWFVITTSYSEYAVESFELAVIDYLLKPVSLERFAKAIARVEKLKENTTESLPEPSFFVKDGDEFTKILVQDVDYIQGLKDYAKIVTGANYALVLKTLKAIETDLQGYQFMRIHKSYIVPLQKITQYNGKCVLINTTEIPVGSSYREGLKTYLERRKL